MSFVIPFFIPHQGCPHQCLFCNQHSITGVDENVRSDVELLAEIELWLPRKRGEGTTQLAFYGGSFTCMAMDTQKYYLSQVQEYIRSGQIDSIRVSTRPDCIDRETCEMLFAHGVRTVELGIQSMDDRVLDYSERGHNSDDNRCAVEQLKKYGFEVGIQLLPGLPGETRKSFIDGVKTLVKYKPDMARIYPAIVVKGSGLEDLYQQGAYRPLSLAEAVVWSAKAKGLFTEGGVRVIRIGLQHSTDLENQFVAGPYHPAMGELVSSWQWQKKMREVAMLCEKNQKGVITINPRDISAVKGMKKSNIKKLEKLQLAQRLDFVYDSDMPRGKMSYVISI